MRVDFEALDRTAERLREHVDTDSPVSRTSHVSRGAWPTVDPLPEAVAAIPAPFPLDGLGPILGAAACAVARDVQTPDSLAAGSVLAAASLAAHAHADVLMPHGQRAPLSLFVVTGAASGDRKSAADSVVLREVEEVRRSQARAYMRERQAAGEDKDASKPVARSLTIGKSTTEGLQMILRSQSSVGLFTAEGGELLGGHSLREERRAAGLAWMLKAWGAETLDALTRGDGLSVLLGRRVAMHAMVQPVLLRSLLADPLAHGQGLLARCLIAEPASVAGTRMFRDVSAAEGKEVQVFHSRMRELLQRQPRVLDGGDGCELQPRALQMDTRAKALWIEFYNDVEREQRDGGDLEHARAFGSKAAEHAARIAGVVQMVADPDSHIVTEAAMDAGMNAATFYLGEHVRLTGAGQESRQIGLLRTLFDVIRSRARVPHRDLLQSSPRAVRALKADGINRLLDELTQRGYIRRTGDTWEANPNA
jgi:putative DNA primase/helicase